MERHNLINRKDVDNVRQRLNLRNVNGKNQKKNTKGPMTATAAVMDHMYENATEDAYCYETTIIEEEARAVESLNLEHETVGTPGLLSRMHEYHNKSLIFRREQITCVEEGFIWRVALNEAPNLWHNVSKTASCCVRNIRCEYCGVCPHLYMCSCPDALIQNAACEHAHLIQGTFFNMAAATDQTDPPAITEEIYSLPLSSPQTTSNNEQEEEPPVTTATMNIQREHHSAKIDKANVKSKLAASKSLKEALKIIEYLPAQEKLLEMIDDNVVASQVLQKAQELQQLLTYALNTPSSDETHQYTGGGMQLRSSGVKEVQGRNEQNRIPQRIGRSKYTNCNSCLTS